MNSKRFDIHNGLHKREYKITATNKIKEVS
jgi:hypothetical protein